MTYLFTSEAVSNGHPDKICDQISDAIVDLCLSDNPDAHTAIEVLATTNRVIVAGETLGADGVSADMIESALRKVIKNIGYEQSGFDWRKVEVTNLLHRQSANIAEGIQDFGAGDQGIMFGYAKREFGFETEFMPLAAFLANKLLMDLSNAKIDGLLPDAKSQITIEYNDAGHAVAVKKIVLSTQHRDDLPLEKVREIVRDFIIKNIPHELKPERAEMLINPAGKFVIGGPDGDAGLTGRKIVVDTYGGAAPHGGGAFSGKDPSKVDRSAAYMLRWLAKNIVAADLADECLLQVSYAIGKAEPLSLFIDCKGTEKTDKSRIYDFISKNIDLTPKGIIKTLQLKRPIYLPTAAYGHFGRKWDNEGHFCWEKTNLVEDLQQCK